MSPEWSGGEGPPRKKPPKYGAHTEMTEVLNIVRGDADQPVAAATLQARPRYANADPVEVSQFVYNARRALDRKDTAEAERLAHAFIVEHRTAEVEPVRLSWWRRFLPWSFPLALTAWLYAGMAVFG